MTNERIKIKTLFIYSAIISVLISVDNAYVASANYGDNGYIKNFIITFVICIIAAIMYCALKAVERNQMRKFVGDSRIILNTKIIANAISIIILGAFGFAFYRIAYGGNGASVDFFPIGTYLVYVAIAVAIVIVLTIIIERIKNKMINGK